MIDKMIKFSEAYFSGFSYGMNSGKEKTSIVGGAMYEACAKTPELPECAGFLAGYKAGLKQKSRDERRASGAGSSGFVCPN